MKKQKTYSTKQVMSQIDKLKKTLKKPKPIINKHLEKYLIKIIKEEVKQDSRSEAIRILKKANRSEVAEFLFTFHSDHTQVGLACSCLDFIKERLKKDGQITKNFGTKFGFYEI